MIYSGEDQSMFKKSSWWKKRSKLERCLVVALILLIVLAISVLTIYTGSLRKKQAYYSTNETFEEEFETEVCYSSACIYASSKVLRLIDDSVDPCHDFYQFACGGFITNGAIPDEEISNNPYQQIIDSVTEKLRALIEEPSKPNDPKAFKLFKEFYLVCINTTAIEMTNFETLFNSVIDVLGGWPVLHIMHWDENTFDWTHFLYKSKEIGLELNSFIDVFKDTDPTNSSRSIIKLNQPSLPFSGEQFLKGFDDESVQRYYEYMIELVIALSLKEDSKEYVRKEMMDVLKFEMELAKDQDNLSRSYNPMTIAELQLRYLDIPWLEFLNNLINITNEPITEEDIVNVANLSYLKHLFNLLHRTPKRILANYAMFKIVDSLVHYLPEIIRNLKKQHFKNVSDTPNAVQPRWKECLETTIENKILGFKLVAGALYANKYLNKRDIEKAESIAREIRLELTKSIEKSEWMHKITRSGALEKAEKIEFHIGYPERLLSTKDLEKIYAEIKIKTNNYLNFALTMNKFVYKHQYSMLGQPTKNHFYTFPPMVTKMYFPESNFLYLPPGILHSQYFDANRPRYMNYGAIGYVIGHEITHGFDELGRKFDKDGNVKDWWSEVAEMEFFQQANCILAQYGNLTVNGTTVENIADNGGIKLAYLAYQTWVEQNEPEKLLPSLNYTQKQMFWISAANSLCSRNDTRNIKLPKEEGNRSPARFRVNIPFSNTEFFAADFNCPVGSKMNPKQKCDLW